MVPVMNSTDQERSAMLIFKLGNKNNCASPLLFPIGLQNIQGVVKIPQSQGQPSCQVVKKVLLIFALWLIKLNAIWTDLNSNQSACMVS
jgi:hypothetical protein